MLRIALGAGKRPIVGAATGRGKLNGPSHKKLAVLIMLSKRAQGQLFLSSDLQQKGIKRTIRSHFMAWRPARAALSI